MDRLAGKPYQHGTGIVGPELDDLDSDFGAGRIDESWPADEDGSKLSLGNSTMHTQTELPPGVITGARGYNDPWEDPVVSEAQRRAMYAAEAGKSRLGIPQSVGKEFIRESHGVRNLPERKGKS